MGFESYPSKKRKKDLIKPPPTKVEQGAFSGSATALLDPPSERNTIIDEKQSRIPRSEEAKRKSKEIQDILEGRGEETTPLKKKSIFEVLDEAGEGGHDQQIQSADSVQLDSVEELSDEDFLDQLEPIESAHSKIDDPFLSDQMPTQSSLSSEDEQPRGVLMDSSSDQMIIEDSQAEVRVDLPPSLKNIDISDLVDPNQTVTEDMSDIDNMPVDETADLSVKTTPEFLKFAMPADLLQQKKSIEESIEMLSGYDEQTNLEELHRLAVESAEFFHLPDGIKEQISNRYILANILTEKGAFGTVFRAYDNHLRMWTVAKVTFGKLEEKALVRFQKETKTLAQMQNPHIVRVLDGGASEGGAWYAMEELQGGDLSNEISEKKEMLSTDQILDYAYQIADGIQATHEKGIVHRDLKPDNIFLDADKNVRVADFGLIKKMSVQKMKESVAQGLVSGRIQSVDLPKKVSERISSFSGQLHSVENLEKRVESELSSKKKRTIAEQKLLKEKLDGLQGAKKKLLEQVKKIASDIPDSQVDSAYAKALEGHNRENRRWLLNQLERLQSGKGVDNKGREVTGSFSNRLKLFSKRYTVAQTLEALKQFNPGESNNPIVEQFQDLFLEVPQPLAISQAGALMGTPLYMSPEQVGGKEVDTATDIWSFGVILHEMTTNEMLFRGNSLYEVMAQIASKPIPELYKVLNDVPKEFSDLVASMLSRAPENRPTIEEVKDGLARIIAERKRGNREEYSGFVSGFIARLRKRIGL